jgi:hypothetical protein
MYKSQADALGYAGAAHAVVLIGSLQRLVPKIPAVLMAVVISILAANVFHLADHGVALVGRRAGGYLILSGGCQEEPRCEIPTAGGGDRRPQRPGTSAFRRDRPMASIFKRVKDFAQSPKGEQVKEQVKEQASKPENRRKLKEFGQRYLKRR